MNRKALPYFILGNPPVPLLYIPVGWNTVWTAAKTNAGTTPAWWAGFGDSTAFGTNTTNYLTKVWFALRRAALIGSYTNYGDYYSVAHCVDFDAAYQGSPPWVITLNGATRSYDNYVMVRDTNFTGGAPTAVYTTPGAVTELSLVHFENWGGTWQFTVNGANVGSVAAAVGGGSVAYGYAAGVLTVTVTNTNATYLGRKIRVYNLDSASHVVTCSTQSGNSVMGVSGIGHLLAATGIGHIWAASNGEGCMTSGSLSTETLRGGGSSFGWPAQPSLAVLQWGINDCQNAMSPATFRNNLQLVINKLRQGVANASIIIVAACNPGPGSDVNQGARFANNAMWPQYVRAMYQVAALKGCAFVNIHRKWGNTPVAQGFVSAGNPHPTDNGHLDISNMLASLI